MLLTQNNDLILPSNTSSSISTVSTPTSSATSFETKTKPDQIEESNQSVFGEVSLAQAELDDDDIVLDDLNKCAPSNKKSFDEDIVEFVDNIDEDLDSEEPSIKIDESIHVNVNMECSKLSDQIKSPTQKLNNQQSNLNSLKSIFLNISNNHKEKEEIVLNSAKKINLKSPVISNKVSCEEKLSNEAKEYWATIDFYNNSKLAFNKRYKSVKLKREKLNAELKQRQTLKSTNNLKKMNKNDELSSLNRDEISKELVNEQSIELCTCVKCTIVYHEAMIRGITNLNEIICTKCNSKFVTCKCCSNSLGSQSNSNINNSNNINNQNRLSVASISILEVSNDKQSPTNNNNINKQNKPQSNEKQECQANNQISKKDELKSELTQFEEKLFNIKTELVNLSETSLDVFQLLLQLSDTMLDLNNQLSSSTNANQLFLQNSHLNLNHNLFLSNTDSYLYDTIDDNETSHYSNTLEVDQSDLNTISRDTKTNPQVHLKSNLIEDFLQKTFYSTQSNLVSPSNTPNTPDPQLQQQKQQQQPLTNKQLNNSISNIINTINNRSTASNKNQIENLKKMFSSPSPSNLKNAGTISPTPSSTSSNFSSTSQNLSNQHPLSPRNMPRKPIVNQSSKLIENLYDKTSVTQFVDSLLNMNSMKTTHQNDDLSRTSSGFYSASSLLTMVNHHEEPNSLLSITDSISHQSYHQTSSLKQPPQQKLSATTATTSHILARQAQFMNNMNSLNGKNIQKSTPIKSSSSSSSSSSGCGGSSLSSSSNIDLASLPSTSSSSTNIVAETVDHRRSFTSKLSNDESNELTHIQNYRHSTASTTSSIGSNPQNDSLTIQSPLSPKNGYKHTKGSGVISPGANNGLMNGSVAGLAASFLSNQQQTQRSNSVNLNRLGSTHSALLNNSLPSSSLTTSPIPNNFNHHLNQTQTARKPSFRFENSTILNRVQNMNLSNKMKLQNDQQQINEMNEEINVNSLIEANKRNSLNRESFYAASDNKLIRRQQSVLNKPTNGSVITPRILLNSKIGDHIRSNHQISLDSGIYVPSENEENLPLPV